MEKKEIKDLALNIMFDVNDDEIQEIENDFINLEKMLEQVEAINTDGVEEMVYPFSGPFNYFREDETSNVLSQDDALSNVKKVKQGHVVVPKVVK